MSLCCNLFVIVFCLKWQSRSYWSARTFWGIGLLEALVWDLLNRTVIIQPEQQRRLWWEYANAATVSQRYWFVTCDQWFRLCYSLHVSLCSRKKAIALKPRIPLGSQFGNIHGGFHPKIVFILKSDQWFIISCNLCKIINIGIFIWLPQDPTIADN